MQLFVGAKGIVHNNGKILLLRESGSYEEGTNEGRWDVPGGRINPEETFAEGLCREVMEEAGLPVSVGEVLGVSDWFPHIKGEKCHVVGIYVLCAAESDLVVLSEDHDAYVWVDRETVREKGILNFAEFLDAVWDKI